MSELAETLLSAHVRHELGRFQGALLLRTLEAHVGATFRFLGEVKLDDVATRAQILGVIERYVIEFRVGGGIAELAGEMSHVVVASPASEGTRVDQILPDASYDQFATKLVGLGGVWHELVRLVSESAAFAEISGEVVSRTLVDLLLERGSKPAAGPTELAHKLKEQVVSGVAQRLTRVLARYFGRQRQHFARQTEQHMLDLLDPVRLRAILDEIWDTVAAMHLSEAFGFIDDHDLEDFVVLGYEFWQAYRKSDYFRQISHELVDYFFTKYGQQTVASLIDDMGVTEQMVSHELMTFLGPLLEHARETGFLEQQIRAQLEPFYRSVALHEILRDQQSG